MRPDLQLIQPWISPNSRVLDLGCGNGQLLQQLRYTKHIDGLGVEIDNELITQCIAKGVAVVEQNLNKGLANFHSNSFDMVVMTQALQTLRHPHLVLEEMLRIGETCIVTFPNFGHWRCRWHLGQRGKMPISPFMPYQWYNTPNIHFCTVHDFETLCGDKNIDIINRRFISSHGKESGLANKWPNLLAVTAIYQLRLHTR